MLHLIKKDLILNRWFFLIAAAAGLMIVPISMNKPETSLFFTLFAQIIFSHLIMNLNRQPNTVDKENCLLLSMPLTRSRIVIGKYVFYALASIMFPLYLSLLTAALPLFSVASGVPFLIQWFLAAAVGLIYSIFLLPVSFINNRYAMLAGAVIYIAIILLPRLLPAWLKLNDFSEVMQKLIRASVGMQSSPVLPLSAAVLFAAGLISLLISRFFYGKAAF